MTRACRCLQEFRYKLLNLTPIVNDEVAEFHQLVSSCVAFCAFIALLKSQARYRRALRPRLRGLVQSISMSRILSNHIKA